MASITAGSPGVHSPERYGVARKLLGVSPQGVSRPNSSRFSGGKFSGDFRTAIGSPKGPSAVWRVKELTPSPSSEALGVAIPSFHSNLNADSVQDVHADQVVDFANANEHVLLSSEFDTRHEEDVKSESDGTEFEEQQTRAQTSATSDMDYCYSVTRVESVESDQISSRSSSGGSNSIDERRTSGTLNVATVEQPEHEYSDAAAYRGASLLTAPFSPVADDVNFPQSNGSDSSLHSNTSRLSEEVLAQLNQNQKSVSSSSSRAQLLLGHRTEGPLTQLECDGVSVLHYLNKLGQTYGGPTLEELMKFQDEMTPRRDDDEVSFDLSQDSESEKAVSPVNANHICSRTVSNNEPEPTMVATELPTMDAGFWDNQTPEVVPLPANTPAPNAVQGVPYIPPTEDTTPRQEKQDARLNKNSNAKTAISRPATSVASRPATSVASRPATSVASRPATSVASHPATSVASRPATSVASRPATSVASHPATSVASRPAGGVTSRGSSKVVAKVKPPSPPKETCSSRLRERPTPATKTVPSHVVAAAPHGAVSRNARNTPTVQMRHNQETAPQNSSLSRVQTTAHQKKNPSLNSNGAPGAHQPKNAALSRLSFSPAPLDRVSAAQLIKEISGASTGGANGSPRRGPSWTELPSSARAQIVEILQQQRIILTSRAQIRKAVEAIRRACDISKSAQRSSSGSSAATSRQSSRTVSRGTCRNVVPKNETPGTSGVASRPAPNCKVQQNLPRRSSVGSRSRKELTPAQTSRCQNKPQLRRSLSENHTSVRATTTAPRPVPTRGRGSVGALALSRSRSNSRLLCPHGLRYKSLCAFCGHPDSFKDVIASKGYAQSTVASRMQATETKKPSTTGRRSTPLKANLSRTKLWAAVGVSSNRGANGAAPQIGIAARTVDRGSRLSVGGASWTSTNSAMTRASTGSTVLDCSVESLPDGRSMASRGRSRISRSLPQHANDRKVSKAVPPVFVRLWEGALERQRSRSQDPTLGGSRSANVARQSVPNAKGGQNLTASRRSLSEKHAKVSSEIPQQLRGICTDQNATGTERTGRRASDIPHHYRVPATQTPSAFGTKQATAGSVVLSNGSDTKSGLQPAPIDVPASYQGPGEFLPATTPPTVPLWQPVQYPSANMMHTGQMRSQDSNFDHVFQLGNQAMLHPFTTHAISPPSQGNSSTPLFIANHHIALTAPEQQSYQSSTHNETSMDQYPRMGNTTMSDMKASHSPTLNQAFSGNETAAFNGFCRPPYSTFAMAPQQMCGMSATHSQFVPVPYPQGSGTGFASSSYYPSQLSPHDNEMAHGCCNEKAMNENPSRMSAKRQMQYPSDMSTSVMSDRNLVKKSEEAEMVRDEMPVNTHMKQDPTAGLSSFCISNLHIESRPIPRVATGKRSEMGLSKTKVTSSPAEATMRAKNVKTPVSRPLQSEKRKVPGESSPGPKGKSGAFKVGGNKGSASGPIKGPQREMSLDKIVSPSVTTAQKQSPKEETSRQQEWQDAWQRQVAEWKQYEKNVQPPAHDSASVDMNSHLATVHPDYRSAFDGTAFAPTLIPSSIDFAHFKDTYDSAQDVEPRLPHAFSFASCPPLPNSPSITSGSLVYVNANQRADDSGTTATTSSTPVQPLIQLPPSSTGQSASRFGDCKENMTQSGTEQETERESPTWGWPGAAEALAITIAEENGMYRQREEEYRSGVPQPSVGSLSRVPRPPAHSWSSVVPADKEDSSGATQTISPSPSIGFSSLTGNNNGPHSEPSPAMWARGNPTLSGARLFRVGGTSGEEKRITGPSDQRYANVLVCGPSGLAEVQAMQGLQRTILGQPPFVRTKPLKAQGSGGTTPQSRGAALAQRMIDYSPTETGNHASEGRRVAFQC